MYINIERDNYKCTVTGLYKYIHVRARVSARVMQTYRETQAYNEWRLYSDRLHQYFIEQL